MRLNITIQSLVFMIAASGSLVGADRFPWLGDLSQARELAASTGKPLLIVFRCEP